jgi:DnaJ-domain-containing protein 1
MLNEKQFETFFKMLKSIVNEREAGESWREAAARVRAAAEINDAEASLIEFAGWFEE